MDYTDTNIIVGIVTGLILLGVVVWVYVLSKRYDVKKRARRIAKAKENK